VKWHSIFRGQFCNNLKENADRAPGRSTLALGIYIQMPCPSEQRTKQKGFLATKQVIMEDGSKQSVHQQEIFQ
jgi:hypothetical protein